MKRENGYIVLEQARKISRIGSHDVYFAYVDGNMYYFKKGTAVENYTNVFCSLLANHLDIPSVSYDLAKYKKVCGTISEDFNPNQSDVYYLHDILKKYYTEVVKKYSRLFSLEKNFKSLYNLEVIWWALDYFYSDHKDKEKIVQSLMDDIVNSFILQIVLGNSDMHFFNLCILGKKDPVLAKNFDYDKCFLADFDNLDYNYELQVSSDKKTLACESTIKSFLSFSDFSFVERLRSKVLKMPSFSSLVLEVEEKTGEKVPREVYYFLASGYNNYLEQLQELVFANFENRKL